MRVGRAALGAVMAAAIVAGIVAFVVAIPPGVPSSEGCADLWNRPTNARARSEVIGFSNVSIRGWDTKAGAHCSATFFDGRGLPWQRYVLWVADPKGVPPAYSADIGGDSFGFGWFFEVAKHHRPNAAIAPDGRLVVD